MQKRLPLKNVIILAILLVVAIASVVVVFRRASSSYQSSMSLESASHLSELGGQVGNALDSRIESKWSDAAVLQDVFGNEQNGQAQDLVPVLKDTVQAKGYSDIYLYTSSGHCIDANGEVMNVETASEMIYQAQTAGRVIKVVRSTVYYTVPVDTSVTLDGATVVALSIVEDTGSALDSMKILSFGGKTSAYLAQGNGLIVSRTGNGDASAINTSKLFSDGTTQSLIGESSNVQDALAAGSAGTFLHVSGTSSDYVVVVPITSEYVNWSLILVAPEDAVNQSSSAYTRFLSLMSATMIVIIVLAIAGAMYYLFRERLKNYREVEAREQMLNLLITNTKSVFALYSVNKRGPLFVSSNAGEILGGDVPTAVDLDAQGSKLMFATADGPDGSYLPKLNSELATWSGAGEFLSSYLPISLNGSTHYIVVRIYPSQTRGEYIVMAQDVTREREREEALRSALEAADYANQAKSRFLSNMSHDIRTPMNAIVNMTDFALQKGTNDEELLQYLTTIKTSSEHLLRLINEVLDMSRIESGKTIVEKAPFDLLERLRETEGIIRPLCMQKGQTLTCTYAINHGNVCGDELKLGQVLINLLNNASKFTEEGGSVSLSVTETGTIRSGTAVYRFQVDDTGIGIPEESLETIFAPFSRVDSAATRKAEGTGLGLSICKSFVDMMNGRISVRSTLGEGSSFVVEIPFDVDVEATPKSEGVTEAEPLPDLTGRRALLVEDNPVNLQIATMMLQRLGMTVTTAENGREALERLAEKTDAFDVVYMDIQMPVMNGYETTVAFRASDHPQAKTLPIIAMTANVFAEDIEKAREAGMNAHVGKPINLGELAKATKMVLNATEKETS